MDAKSIDSLSKKNEIHPGELVPSHPTDEEFYNANYPKKGVMIILNHHTFERSKHTSRDGTEKDLAKLKDTFTKIGYSVRDYTDEKSDNIIQILDQVSKEDHSNHMSLVIAMLTHGDSGGQLYTYDSQISVEELWKPFTADKCKSLAGKPKLFFLQACKGKMVDPGAFVEVKVEVGEMAFCSRSASYKLETFVIPTTADILVYYSTAEGYPSFRNTEEGSWFIQTLCEKFETYLKDDKEEQLTIILTAVSRDIAYGRQSNGVNGSIYDACKQMPTVMSMLTKVLVFNRNVN